MLFYFACEAAGASAPGIPHALLMERRKILAHLGRIRAARTRTLARRTRVAADRHSPLATHHPSSPNPHAGTHTRREQFCAPSTNPRTVMPGLVPGIHVLARRTKDRGWRGQSRASGM